MSRNLKRDYIVKMMHTEAPNGYKFDLANYLHNPSYDCDYPAWQKLTEETADRETFRRVYYMKYYDGSGEYFAETFSREKNGDSWQIIRDTETISLEKSNRFSVKKLLSFCI